MADIERDAGNPVMISLQVEGEMVMRYAFVMALLCALIVGCEKSPNDEMKTKVDDAKGAAMKAEDTVFGGSVKALDKAKDVGQTLMDSAAAQRNRIDNESE